MDEGKSIDGKRLPGHIVNFHRGLVCFFGSLEGFLELSTIAGHKGQLTEPSCDTHAIARTACNGHGRANAQHALVHSSEATERLAHPAECLDLDHRVLLRSRHRERI